MTGGAERERGRGADPRRRRVARLAHLHAARPRAAAGPAPAREDVASAWRRGDDERVTAQAAGAARAPPGRLRAVEVAGREHRGRGRGGISGFLRGCLRGGRVGRLLRGGRGGGRVGGLFRGGCRGGRVGGFLRGGRSGGRVGGFLRGGRSGGRVGGLLRGSHGGGCIGGCLRIHRRRRRSRWNRIHGSNITKINIREHGRHMFPILTGLPKPIHVIVSDNMASRITLQSHQASSESCSVHKGRITGPKHFPRISCYCNANISCNCSTVIISQSNSMSQLMGYQEVEVVRDGRRKSTGSNVDQCFSAVLLIVTIWAHPSAPTLLWALPGNNTNMCDVIKG